MLLTQRQKEALIQFSKIGLDDSEKSLSELVDTPINITISDVVFYPLSYLTKEFSSVLNNDFTSINKNIAGGLSGNGLLVFEYANAVSLVNLLQNNPEYSGQKLNISAQEILIEVGNIIVGNYLDFLGGLTENPFRFSPSYFEVISFYNLINKLIVNASEIRYVLLTSLALNLRGKTLNGYILLVSGVMTLSCLIRGIESSNNLINSSFQQNFQQMSVKNMSYV